VQGWTEVIVITLNDNIYNELKQNEIALYLSDIQTHGDNS